MSSYRQGMNGQRNWRIAVPVCLLALCLAAGASLAGPVTVTRLFNLADFSGDIPFNQVRLFPDAGRGEIYVSDGEQLRIFNEAGMEVHRFEGDVELASASGLAVEPSGSLIALVWMSAEGEQRRWRIIRRDYRGAPLGPIQVTGLPAALATFTPSMLFARGDAIQLVSPGQMLVVEIGRDGAFRKALDLGALLGLSEEDRNSCEISGFNMDEAGTMIFTIPTFFHVYLVAPDGKVTSFGRKGSAPGLFGVVGGVVTDPQGNLYVADRLRNVVMVFDPSFHLITEIGEKGGADTLVRPTDLAFASGHLYITQTRNRGVAVYSATPVS